MIRMYNYILYIIVPLIIMILCVYNVIFMSLIQYDYVADYIINVKN